MDCSPLDFSVHGTLQAGILEWVAMSTSRGTSRPRDWTHISYISCIGSWVLYHSRHLGSPVSKMASVLMRQWIVRWSRNPLKPVRTLGHSLLGGSCTTQGSGSTARSHKVGTSTHQSGGPVHVLHGWLLPLPAPRPTVCPWCRSGRAWDRDETWTLSAAPASSWLVSTGC